MSRRAAEQGGAPSAAVQADPDRIGFSSVEWPTLFLALGIYAGYGLLTWSYHLLPWWLVLPLAGYLVCLHGSLQHEAVHCHPTRRPWLNELMVFPSLWLWLPYRLYRELHCRHHATPELTDPQFDPESYYLGARDWRSLSRLGRTFYWTRNSLAGRLLLGPVEAVVKTYRAEGLKVLRGDFSHLGYWAVHLIAIVPVLIWVLGVCRIPLAEYILLFAYPGLALTLLRSFLEHRAHSDPAQRTVVIEAEPPFALLFLNNNLHALHHAEPQLAWYRLPARFRQERSRLLQNNGGYRFTGYLEIFKRYLFRAKETPHYPGPGFPAAALEAADRRYGLQR